jgi:hypothetical protein
MSNLQQKPSALKREPQAFQNMKFLDFLWVIYSVLDLDPISGSGYGSIDLIESGSNLDPDPGYKTL